MPQNEYDKLVFSRQFLISEVKNTSPVLENFEVLNFDSLFVYVHPECELTYVKKNEQEILLLGYALNTLKPEQNNKACVEDIIASSKNIAELTENTNSFNGRWVIVYKDPSGIYIFNDATGLKQVFYSTINGIKTLSSSENLIAEVHQLTVSQEVKTEFFKPMKDHVGWWWPGKSTPYKEVEALIPNHYLNFQTQEVRRFWPNKKIKFIKPVLPAYEQVDSLLKDSFKAFFNRYRGNLALTGGIDSRLNLAYCKPYLDKTQCSTFYYESEKDKEDFEIPKLIAKRFNLNYKLYKAAIQPDKEFIEFYNRNSSLKNTFFCDFNYTGFLNFPKDQKYIGGVLNEIIRAKFWYRPFDYRPKDIANMTYMGENKFSEVEFEFWLKHALEAKKKYNTKTEDLFLIEQKLGRWNAMLKGESDFLHDTFEPFNCRNLLFFILSIETKHKGKGFNEPYAYFYNQNWPELLTIPSSSFKPPRKKSLKTHVYEWMKWVYYRF